MAAYTGSKAGTLNIGGIVAGVIPDNVLNSNPLRVERPGTIISEEVLVQAMEWIDSDSANHGNIANDSDLIMTINGVLYQLNTPSAVAKPWGIQLSHPIRVNKLVVTTIDGGTLLIWKA